MTTHGRPGALVRFISLLRGLVSECERSAQVLHRAAAEVSDPTLKPLLDAYALRRDVTAAQLSVTLAEFGATPAVVSSLGGAAGGHADGEIVGACERSETRALERFRRLLATEVPEAAQLALERCFDEILTVWTVLHGWLGPAQPRLAAAAG